MPANAEPTSVAIYARFSSDQQNERSIADQVALCRDYAERQGWSVGATYSDFAISGASVHGRAEYQRMLVDAEAGRFAIVLAEDVDRYARNAGDAMRLKETADFVGVRIFTVADGEASDLLFGFKGIMAAEWRKTHALKVKRGQDGRTRAGKIASGLSYGYAAVLGAPGERTIVEAQAAIVRRIFTEYLAGTSPRAIAIGLNRDGVPAPRGPQWNASSIAGNGKRGNGILHNQLYGGTIERDRVRMVKDPKTGKRLSRINAVEARRTVAAPALAIVPPDMFAAVQDRLRACAGIRPEQQRRPRHILSGLLRCAACGGGLSVSGRHGAQRRIRLRCSNSAATGNCPAPATFYLDLVEAAVLDGLRAELRAPAVIAEYVREYHAERQRLAAGGRQRREAIERRLAQIARELQRAVDAILQGVDGQIMGERTNALVAERAALADELAGLGQAAQVIALHPATLARFEAQIATLQESLGAGLSAGDQGGTLALRELVEAVTVARDPQRPGGLQIAIAGRLDRILGMCGERGSLSRVSSPCGPFA